MSSQSFQHSGERSPPTAGVTHVDTRCTHTFRKIFPQGITNF